MTYQFLNSCVSQIDDFIESIEKFVSTLSAARSNMEGRFELDEVDVGYNLHDVTGPQDYAQVVLNLDLVDKLEGVLAGWCKQIDQVVSVLILNIFSVTLLFNFCCK